MGNVELNSDQKSVIWRYMDIWRRWRRLPNGHRRFEDLQEDMAQGYGMLLCGILVEAQASTVITADVTDPKFFAAIFGNDDDAVPDMTADELERTRQYIHSRTAGDAGSQMVARRTSLSTSNRLQSEARFSPETRTASRLVCRRQLEL